MKKNILFSCLALAQPFLGDTNILVFAGSTRADSYNKKLAQEAAEIAQEMGAKVTLIDLKDYPMPFYDADLEKKEGMPENAKRLRDMMIASHAILISSPEYNGSLSAVLKNAIDWTSRSEEGGSSRDAFKGKRFAIMSAAPGKTGGARGLVHLRAILGNIGGEVVEKEVVVPGANESVLESEAVKEELKEELAQLLVPKS